MAVIKPFFTKMRHLGGQSDEEFHHQQWITLRIFSGYRFLLSIVLLILFFTDIMEVTPLEGQHEMAMSILVIYSVINLITFAAVFTRIFSLFKQTFIVVLVDILIFTLLMYSTGGINFGFGILINASIAAGSILVTGPAIPASKLKA